MKNRWSRNGTGERNAGAVYPVGAMTNGLHHAPGTEAERPTGLGAMLRGELGRERAILARMNVGFLAWIVVYLFLQGQNGFFAITVDRIDALWLELTVLNIPLHLALTIVVLGCTNTPSGRLHRVGLALGAVNAVLIAAHVALSVATA